MNWHFRKLNRTHTHTHTHSVGPNQHRAWYVQSPWLVWYRKISNVGNSNDMQKNTAPMARARCLIQWTKNNFSRSLNKVTESCQVSCNIYYSFHRKMAKNQRIYQYCIQCICTYMYMSHRMLTLSVYQHTDTHVPNKLKKRSDKMRRWCLGERMGERESERVGANWKPLNY